MRRLLGWRWATRALIVGVTVVVIVVAAVARQRSGSASRTPIVHPAPAASCHVSTALGTPLTMCAEGTPSP